MREQGNWRTEGRGRGIWERLGPEEAGVSRSGGDANERANDLAAESHRIAEREAIACQPRDFDLDTLGDRACEGDSTLERLVGDNARPDIVDEGRSEAIRERAVVAIAGVEARPDSKGKVDVREA